MGINLQIARISIAKIRSDHLILSYLLDQSNILSLDSFYAVHAVTLLQNFTMAQQRSAAALEPFLALAPSATSPRAAAELITRATGAPHAYSFAELLQKPNIQKLRTAESEQHRAHLKLLEIFTWGTWQDYNCMCIIVSFPVEARRQYIAI